MSSSVGSCDVTNKFACVNNYDKLTNNEQISKIINTINRYYIKLDHKSTIYRIKRQNNIINSPRYNNNYNAIYSLYKRRLNKKLRKIYKKYNYSKKAFLDDLDDITKKLLFDIQIIINVEMKNKSDKTFSITYGLFEIKDIKQFIYYLIISKNNKLEKIMNGDTSYIYNLLSRHKEDLIQNYSIDYRIIKFLETKKQSRRVIILKNLSVSLKNYNLASNYYEYYYMDFTRTFKLRTLDLESLLV